jgi:hypothetical protein
MESACRFCLAPLRVPFADLGMSPLANSYLSPEQANAMEPFYPLRALVCEDASSQVVELASNDGYLLQFFGEREIPVLGIEPAANVAEVARQKGIPTLVEFFGAKTARSVAARSRADLLVGNNVLAHVPDLNDFVAGMKILLADDGQITMEFPHLMRLVEGNQWDTIYHEQYTSYGRRVAEEKRHVLEFLIGLKREKQRIVGYGAPAKGNTLLNYCGVRTDFIEYTCDLNPHKQGQLLPGTHIPIRSPDVLREDRPDVVLILPWNLKDEIMEQLSFIREWGGRFAARTPDLTLLP